MRCPCCHTRLEEESYAGIRLAVCPICQGLCTRDDLEKPISLFQEVERGWESSYQLYEAPSYD
jgi:Zn-finger nucleic acid-binding protein